MHTFATHCRRALEDIHRQGRYRRFTPLTKQAGRFPIYRLDRGGAAREVTVWSSNDYLGMGNNPVVLETMQYVITCFLLLNSNLTDHNTFSVDLQPYPEHLRSRCRWYPKHRWQYRDASRSRG